MEELIRALLLADSGVSGLVGTTVNYGQHPAGKPLPGVLLTVISDTGGYLVNKPGGLDQARIQVDCDALSYREAKQISRAVRAALSGHAGGGIKGVFHASTRDSHKGGSNEVSQPYRVSLDFHITYSI